MRVNIEVIYIFDKAIPQKFKNFINLHKNKFNKYKSYILKNIYNVESVLDEEELNFENSIYKNVRIY